MKAKRIVHRSQAIRASVHRVANRALRLRANRIALLVLVVGLLGLGVSRYQCYLATSDQPSETYPLLALNDYHRLLVLAPHCDDEVLGAGGLIQAALRQGMDVRVVIATAGDGFARATMAQFNHPVPNPRDYVAMGKIRQQESRDALALLGLPSGAVTFLTYPERGLAAMWWNRWLPERPYRSPFTGLEQSVYQDAFRADAPYSGEMLLNDLRAILEIERPDLIIVPHPNDEHIDHRALSAFAILAVEMERTEHPEFQPQLLGYLVHYGRYPQPYGMRPGASLRPPRRLEALGEWLQWRLSVPELAAKREAVKAYRSQQRVLGGFLNSFVRQNELFMRLEAVPSLGLVEGETFPDPNEVPEQVEGAATSSQRDPVSDSIVRRINSGADIADLHVLRLGDSLWVAADVEGRLSRAYDYVLNVRAFTSSDSLTWSGHWGRTSTGGVIAVGNVVWYRLDLEALGWPTWVVMTAETRQVAVLDTTAWYLIRIEE
jgi:LmbE family N-acetylglucosaminyl deacetylase